MKSLDRMTHPHIILDVSNIVCDHCTPLSMGGKTNVGNLQMICKRCDVDQVKPERMINGYCRHCQGALRNG